MLQITNLSKKYSNSDVYAVQDVTFEVKEGEVFGFLGPNGAGKSTTIKCLMGILPFDSGSIVLDGKNLQEDPIAVKSNIGYVSDNHLMYDKLTAREYVDFMADMFKVGVNDRKSRVDKLLEMFELGDVYDKSISTFSHGMKQKICVIGALVHKPKLWVLDEPLTGLDPKSAFILKELMKEHVKEGNSVFFSSHMLEVVEKVCDKIAIIDKGKLLLVSDMDKLHDNASQLSLEEFFLSVTNADSEPDVDFD